MRIDKCWFCSSAVYPGHGITFVRNDATVFKFCRSKCHKNFKMKRNPRKVRWTKAYRKLAGKELAEDATFEMERRRNRPEKYDRELVKTTVRAVEKIAGIRKKRQDRFHEKRAARARAVQVAQDKAVLEQQIHLIKAPAGIRAKDRPAKDKAGKAKAKVKVAAEQRAGDAMQE
jgi:large subunit ribosomal protein L24e